MTVVVVYDYAYINGGAAKVAIQSAIELSKKGVDVVYFAAVGPICRELKESSVEIICMNILDINLEKNRLKAIKNGIYNRKAETEFADLLNKLDHKTTVVHFHGVDKALSSSVVKVAAKRGYKTAWTLHDYFSACPNGGFFDYKENKICKHPPMSMKCILCNCDKRMYVHKIWRVVRQLISNRYVRYNIKLIYIYISQFSFDKIKEYLSSTSTYYVQNPYDLGDEIIYYAEKNFQYIYVGRISEEKGVDLFCEAIDQLMKENRFHGKAIVVGEGQCKEKLEKQYANISFVGWKSREEIQSIIKESRCLVFPSRWYENAPLTPIEVMCHGIPCVVSNCCAATEYIVDGKNGYLFEHENVEDLKEKIISTQDDKIWGMIASNLRDSFERSEFTSEKHVEALLNIYSSLLN